MTWSLPEPMLTVPVDSPGQPAGWAAEPKWDGVAVHDHLREAGERLGVVGERTWLPDLDLRRLSVSTTAVGVKDTLG